MRLTQEPRIINIMGFRTRYVVPLSNLIINKRFNRKHWAWGAI